MYILELSRGLSSQFVSMERNTASSGKRHREAVPETMRKEKQGVIICLIQQSLSRMAIPTAFIRVSGKRRNAGSGPACVMISVAHCHRARNYCQHVNIPCHPRFYSIASHSLESCSLLLRCLETPWPKSFGKGSPALGFLLPFNPL